MVLGLMTSGPEGTQGARITSLDESNECLDFFQTKGYKQIDTARLYCSGRQEAFTRAAQWRQCGLEAAAKWYLMGAGSHKADILKARLEESLRELGTNSLDVFYLHAADRSTPFAETFQALDELYRQGKFQRLRLSNFAALEVAEVVTMCNEHGWLRPTVYQGLTMAEVALRWCVHHSALNVNLSGGDGVIVGFSSLQQLKDNITHLEKGPLPPELVDGLDRSWSLVKGDSPWHGQLEYGYDTRSELFSA
ncbi:NADP-dependent oxidoreductase domain-containing protein [Aspergillus navahoensis]